MLFLSAFTCPVTVHPHPRQPRLCHHVCRSITTLYQVSSIFYAHESFMFMAPTVPVVHNKIVACIIPNSPLNIKTLSNLSPLLLVPDCRDEEKKYKQKTFDKNFSCHRGDFRDCPFLSPRIFLATGVTFGIVTRRVTQFGIVPSPYFYKDQTQT